jgi:Bacterial PH domain/Short C-terminal domain
MLDDIKKYLNENQDPKAVEKIIERLKGILMAGEEVDYIAVQKKPAVNISPDCVAFTSKRIIFFRPKNLGFSMEFQDCLWKDIEDCHLKEEIFGAVFIVKTVKGVANKIDYLPKSQARRLYTISQEQEEIQREYRREREMEEKRAAAGHVVVNSNIPSQENSMASQTEDPVATLRKLKTLLDNGLISQQDFEDKKAEVLKRL